MITPEMSPAEALAMRKQMGKEKKLWRLEVLGRIGNVTHRYHAENRTSEEVSQFREGIYRIGMMLPVEPGKWIVIHPHDLLEFFIWKQEKFFET